MKLPHLKYISLLSVFCLLPFGLRAQTAPTVVNTAETAVRALAADADLTVEEAGSIIVASGSAVTGAGDNIIINSSEISSGDAVAIAISADGFTLTNNEGGTITSTIGAITAITGVVISNSGTIDSTGGAAATSTAISLSGTADATLKTANATRPAHDASEEDRDAYYFNAKITNEESGIIRSKGAGHTITFASERNQLINHGTITVVTGTADTGNGIVFFAGGDQSFIYNTGSITVLANAIHAVASTDEIVIHNTGTIESSGGIGIFLQSLNLVVNSNAITGGTHGIHLNGAALATTVSAENILPVYDATETLRDAYYFNNKVVNEADGVITGAGAGHGIAISGKRAQILNDGSIVAEGTGSGIAFIGATATAGEGFVYSTGSITAASGNAIHTAADINQIIIHNTGTLESTTGTAIVLQNLSLVVNSGEITGGVTGIQLAGTPLAATITAQPTAPAWDAVEADRGDYYFNNIVMNEVGGTITGAGVGHGIHVVNKRTQIFNYGDIVAEGTGHGIYFDTASGESIVVNTGSITSAEGWGIYAHDDTAGSIVVVNGGTITGELGAIRLSGANDILVIRRGSNITGEVDFDEGTDELIYAGGPQLAETDLSNLETTNDYDGDSTLGIGASSSSTGSNYESLFALSDELIIDLNAGIQDAIYEHNFSLNSEKATSAEASWWAQGFGSIRSQDETDDSAAGDYTLGGILIGYDLARNEDRGIGFFLGIASGSLDADDEAELTNQGFFGGVHFDLARDNVFYGFNITLGFTSHDSERSVEESSEDVKIKGDYKGYFFSPEFIIGMKTQMSSVDMVPSFRIRYLFASLKDYVEDGDAADRVSVEKRNTGTVESRAQLTFPVKLSNQAWGLEPRLGLEYRFDLNKDSFDVEAAETETAIDYDVEKESAIGFFGGLSVRYLTGNTNLKFNVDVIFSDESLVLRGQAGFGFGF